MGQRHQAFLIARIRPYGSAPDQPPQYRCIAAYHHQWCYGRLPLRFVRRFVTLAQNKENAAVIRAELRAIDGKYGADGEEPEMPVAPCPYTASLLAAALTVDLDGIEGVPYFSGSTFGQGLLHAETGCWGGDMNDGITIIDITDPESPAYCFAQADMVLTAEGYIRDYYPEYKPDPRLAKGQACAGLSDKAWSAIIANDERNRQTEEWGRLVINSLADVRVLPGEALQEAWLDSHFEDYAEFRTNQAAVPPPIPVDPALQGTIERSLQSEDSRILEQLISLPGQAAHARNILRGMVPFPDGGIAPLIRTLARLGELEQPFVDLSDFQLSTDQVLDIASHCSRLVSLNLSYNTLMTADDIPVISAALPSLRRLIIMECPSVDDEELLDWVRTSPLAFKSLEGILHPEFVGVSKAKAYPIHFSVIQEPYWLCPDGVIVSLPLFTPAQVVQSLTDWLGVVLRTDPCEYESKPAMGVFSTFAGVRTEGRPWAERTVVTVPTSVRRRDDEAERWTFWFIPGPSFCDREKSVRWAFGRTPVSTSKGKNVFKDELVSWPRQWWLDEEKADLFDLHGFLRCMEEQGRPMPTPEAVSKLDELLTTPAWANHRPKPVPVVYAGSEK